jgi:hypothetical protein
MKREELIHVLKTIGIKKVRVHYSGSGDSGAVDAIDAYTDEKKLDTATDIDAWFRDTEASIPIRVDNILLKDKDVLLTDILEDFSYKTLDEAQVEDWCNDDGGYGVLTINVDNDKIHILHSVYVIHTEKQEYDL